MQGIKIWFLLGFQFTFLNVRSQEFLVGADLSYVNELESCGAVYQDRSGSESDPYVLFGNEGADVVRLRLWHDPEWTNYSNLEDVKIAISRAKSNGMSVMLDFHYSDFWADPGRQWRPDAWEAVESDEVLGDSVYNYTRRVLEELHTLDLMPEFVQIGNETNGNILLSRDGSPIDGTDDPELYPVNWQRQAMLLQSGIDAVNDLNSQFGLDIKSIIHISDPLYADVWFESAIANGLADFDIIGLSYYPQWHQMGVRELGNKVAELIGQFDKAVMIVETGYPWTADSQDPANNILNYDGRLLTYSNTFSIETQRDFMIELSWLVRENGGLGVIYWEPAWVSSSCQTYWGSGSHYENATLFDFEGRLHQGADFFSYDYTQMPAALGDQQMTFSVDMTNVEVESGVYVTGSFTGDSWQFMPMTLITGSLYQYSTTIPGRSDGAYIFYTNDDWSDLYRENVPDQCARRWGTHREYWVRDEQAEFYFSWGRCDQEPNEVVLGVSAYLEVSIFPTIAQNMITIQCEDQMIAVELFDSSGKISRLHKVRDKEYNVGHLKSGLYLLNVLTSSGTRTLRFIKE